MFFRNTEFHQLIPERLEILQALEKYTHTKHHAIPFAQRKLNIISYLLNPKAKKTILISIGIHGCEPAPVYAIQNIIQKVKPKHRVIIVPCINPWGFVTNTAHNKNDKDLNRNFSTSKQKENQILKTLVQKYQPDYVYTCHEDPDESKFFLYLEDDDFTKAQKILKHVTIPIYKNKKIHKDTVINGIIHRPKHNTTFEDYLRDKGIPNICIETPGMLPLTERITQYERILKIILI